MKKVLSLVFILVMTLCCTVAFADDYENPILFRKTKWGASYNDVLKQLPNGVKLYDFSKYEYWYPITDFLYDTILGSDHYKAELGCYTYSKSSSMKDVKVAGYEVESIYLYFVYLPDDDGLLIKDQEHTSLIFAYYKLEPKDPDGVYADLINKLISLYGDVDVNQKKSPYISYEQNLWNGADGTMVSLVREDYPSGSHYIYIKYGFKGADDLIADAYNAVVLEESLNAASNVDGL